MKILFITKDLLAANVAKIMHDEGHDVKLYIESKKQKNNFDFLIPKIKNWKNELSWVGKDGLIVFDDIGYGKTQDLLRKKGYTVYGGNFLSDRLEMEREEAQEIFKKYGMSVKKIYDFKNVYEALNFVIENPKAWVIKQNDKSPKTLNYVGVFDDARDVISVLKNYLVDKDINTKKISLQEKICGVEIACGRYFNGEKWIGPVEFNVEHKKFFPGDIGPTTSEMGTLAWYDESGFNSPIYKNTLEKIEPYLKKINFKGHFDINCIVNKDGIFPLEATPRFGSPIVHLQTEINITPWSEILYNIAKGKDFEIKFKKGFGIVVLIALPPFPYLNHHTKMHTHNSEVFFKEIDSEQMKHFHFEEISLLYGTQNSYFVSDYRGYVMYVTGMGKTPEEAIKNTYKTLDKVIIPKMIYRNDIGKRFAEKDFALLKNWGYF